MFAAQGRESFYDQLLNASILPNSESLSELLTNDFFHDSRNKLNWIFEKALVNKDTRIIEFLLSSGVGIHRLNNANQTALHLAARHDFLDIVDVLFDHCKINCRDVHGLTHFHVACIAGNVEMVKYFLSHRVDVNTVETKDFFTSLHFAVVYRRIEVIELLLRYGADPNAVDRCYRTPLHLICQDHSTVGPKNIDDELRILELLIEFGSDINSKDRSRDTPLMYVFRDSYPERVHSQMHYCSKVERRQVLDGYRKLQKGKIELLLRHKADVRLINTDDETALHIVISDVTRRSRASCELQYLDDAVNVEVSELLLSHGARVNARNKRNETPLQIAVSVMSFETVKLLLSHKADVNDLRFEKGCFRYFIDDLPCLEVAENLIGIIEMLWDRGFQMSPRDNLAVLNFLVPDNERFCHDDGKDMGTAYKLKNLLEYGTLENIQSVLNNIPANLDDTSLSEQYSRRYVIHQIQQYLTTLKTGKLYLDDDKQQYLQEKISNLRKYLLGILFTTDTSNRTELTSLENEIQLMKTTMLTEHSSLHDNLRRNPYKIRSRELSSNFKSEDFSNRFSRCIGIIKGHFTKSLIRCYVSRSAEECLSSMVMVAKLPQLCCQRICEYLSNECLVNVCTAAAMNEYQVAK